MGEISYELQGDGQEHDIKISWNPVVRGGGIVSTGGSLVVGIVAKTPITETTPVMFTLMANDETSYRVTLFDEYPMEGAISGQIYVNPDGTYHSVAIN